MIYESKVRTLIGVKFVISDELSSLFDTLEIETVPIKDRTAAQYKTNGLQIVERKIIDSFQPLAAISSRRRGTRVWRFYVGWRGQLPEFVLVTSPDARRRSDKVPKKMPSVRPSTVSWAPYAPLDAKSTTGTAPRSTYQKSCFIVVASPEL